MGTRSEPQLDDVIGPSSRSPPGCRQRERARAAAFASGDNDSDNDDTHATMEQPSPGRSSGSPNPRPPKRTREACDNCRCVGRRTQLLGWLLTTDLSGAKRPAVQARNPNVLYAFVYLSHVTMLGTHLERQSNTSRTRRLSPTCGHAYNQHALTPRSTVVMATASPR